MNYKRWLIAGGIVFVFSVISGTIGMLWWMWSVINKTGPPISIHDDGSIDMPIVVYVALFMFLGVAAGMVIMAVGAVKAHRYGKAKTGSEQLQ